MPTHYNQAPLPDDPIAELEKLLGMPPATQVPLRAPGQERISPDTINVDVSPRSPAGDVNPLYQTEAPLPRSQVQQLEQQIIESQLPGAVAQRNLQRSLQNRLMALQEAQAGRKGKDLTQLGIALDWFGDTPGQYAGIAKAFAPADRSQDIAALEKLITENISNMRGDELKQIETMMGKGLNRELEDKKLAIERTKVEAKIRAADKKAKDPKQFQWKAGWYAGRAEDGLELMETILKENPDLMDASKYPIKWLEGPLLALQPEAYQLYAKAGESIVAAILRRDTGAQINDSEFLRNIKENIPRPGDGPSVVKEKLKDVRRKIARLNAEAGPEVLRANREEIVKMGAKQHRDAVAAELAKQKGEPKLGKRAQELSKELGL